MKATTVVFFMVVLILSSCSSAPEKPAAAPELPPRIVQVNMIVSEQANPDVDGRPSPIVMRIYELKNLGKFEGGDFYQLFENYDAQLGPELIVSEQYHLKPGEVKKIKRTLSADTQYVAVSVAFRDLNQAIWKDSIRVTDDKSTDLLVLIEKLNTSIWKK